MFLLDSLFKSSDIIAVPIFFMILLMAFSIIIKKYKNDETRRLYLRAFYFKMFFSLAYTILNTFYYRGGDTEMYYFATQYLHQAVNDDGANVQVIYATKMINVKTELMNYFLYQNSEYPTFEAMHNPGNFLVPKLGLPFALAFADSYLCIAMAFSFFALGGMIRLYKVFIHYYPGFQKEIAFACFFIPSACFWSAGLMKDPICFGCVGYIVYAIFSVFVRRKKIIMSAVWLTLCITLLFHMKVYILLGLAPAIVLWLATEYNKLIENKTLRNIMWFMTLAIGGTLALVLVNYVTSDESLQQFSLDSIGESSAKQRELYGEFSNTNNGSYYSIGTTNPVLLILNGIVATLYRPFLWEVNGPTALLSAMESLFFLYMTFILMYKKGVLTFFKNAISQPVLLMCLVFSLVFAAAVGSTALNFGSVSRYKIPCLPFYLLMIMILYRQAGLQFPNWFKRLLGYKVIIARKLRKSV
jgi:hypothetical protein